MQQSPMRLHTVAESPSAHQPLEPTTGASSGTTTAKNTPVLDQHGNRCYDLNALLGVSVVIPAAKENSDSSSSNRARQPGTTLALQSSHAPMASHQQHHSWTLTNGEDHPSEFSMHSTQEPLDEQDILYVYNNDVPQMDNEENGHLWFRSDGPLPEPRCCICLKEMIRLRPCPRCSPSDPCHLCDECAARTEHCMCCLFIDTWLSAYIDGMT
eukprot:6475850-Amphidinium_carterae.4